MAKKAQRTAADEQPASHEETGAREEQTGQGIPEVENRIPVRAGTVRGKSLTIELNQEEKEIVIESLVFRRNHLPSYLRAFQHQLEVIRELLRRLS